MLGLTLHCERSTHRSALSSHTANTVDARSSAGRQPERGGEDERPGKASDSTTSRCCPPASSSLSTCTQLMMAGQWSWMGLVIELERSKSRG